MKIKLISEWLKTHRQKKQADKIWFQCVKRVDTQYIMCLMNLMEGLRIEKIELFITTASPKDYKRLGERYYEGAMQYYNELVKRGEVHNDTK